VSVIWSTVGPTHNKQVSFVAVLSIEVSLNTGNRQCVPYVHYNAMQPFNGSGDDPRIKSDSVAVFVVAVGHSGRINGRNISFQKLVSVM
jgi:hypothetical protein